MLALAIYFERRSSCGRSHKTERWRSLVQGFGVDHVFVIDRVDLPCFSPEFPSFSTVNKLDEITFDGDFVFVDNVCPPNRVHHTLPEFNHPANACYVMGADARGIADIDVRAPTEMQGDWVGIPTSTHHGIWSEQAAAIILSHRWMNNAYT